MQLWLIKLCSKFVKIVHPYLKNFKITSFESHDDVAGADFEMVNSKIFIDDRGGSKKNNHKISIRKIFPETWIWMEFDGFHKSAKSSSWNHEIKFKQYNSFLFLSLT